MNSGAGHPAPERIVTEATLGEVLSQLLTAEARSAIAAAGKQVVTFADQLRPVLATLLKQLMPLARSMEAVFQAPPAASYEPLLIEMGYAPVEARIRSRWILTNGGRWAKDWTFPDASSPQPCEKSSRQPIRAPGHGAPGGGPPPAPR